MDAKPPSEPLKYQTWFLKVSIHCEGCRRKVKKVLKSIDGVFTATIDPHQHKVTVTGNVGVETLMRKLVRAGKHAEIWPESLNNGKGKTSNNSKNKNKNELRETHTEKAAAKCENKNKSSSSKTTAGDLPEKPPAGESTGKSPAGDIQGKSLAGEVEHGGEAGSGKNKKKKNGGGENKNSGLSLASKGAPAHSGFQGVGQEVNLSPTRQQLFSYPESDYHPMVHVAAYNRFYPMGNSYYVPPSPYYMSAGLDQYGTYQFQSAPLVSFEIFSDENANGCFIM